MAIVKMRRLRLAAMAQDRDRLMRELMVLGCVELTEARSVLDDPEWADALRRDETELSGFRAGYIKMSSAFDTLMKYDETKKPLFPRLPDVGLSELFSDDVLAGALYTAGEIEVAEGRIIQYHAEKNKLTAARAALMPWAEMDLPLETVGTRECTVSFLTAPFTAGVDEMRVAIAEVTELAELILVNSDQEQSYLTLICHKSELENVVAALRPFGTARANFAGYTNTAAANLAGIVKRLAKLDGLIESEIEGIRALISEKPKMELALDRLNQDISREEAREKLLLTKNTVMLEGWMPASSAEELSGLLDGYCAAWELSEPTEDEYPEVPVKLKNNRLTRCLNMVTEMYSLPAYGAVDPNPLMAPFFILFYGIMMADIGYGLIMLIAGLVMLGKVKPKGGMRNFFELMTYCGISTIVWGAVTGGFFSDFLPQLLKVLNPDSTFVWFWAPLFTPLDDTLMVLIGAMALGFIHIVTGMAISFVRKARAGHVMDGVWDEGTWWVIFAGIGLYALGIGNVSGVPVVLAVGLLMLIIGAGRNAKGFGKIAAVFGSLYNGVTGFFGDILSYSRLMTLMLAGSVIAQVFNTIGAIPGNIVVFIIISLAGNTLNFALNLLGCFVHDLRLQCLEYFGKFYDDGGRAFKPLEIKTKFVNTIKE